MTTSDIEEVASDVFLSLWNNAEKVDAKKLKAYLGSIARNKSKDKLRELDVSLHIEDDIILLSDGTPEVMFIEKEQQLIIKKAILTLICCRQFEGMPAIYYTKNNILLSHYTLLAIPTINKETVLKYDWR